MSLTKNDIITLDITDFNVTGAGVGKTDGVPVFVSGAVPGDTVRAKITKVKKHYAYARTEEILRPSADRTEAPCPVHGQCGSCQLQTYAYEAQLRYKERKVKDALVRVGGFDEGLIDAVMKPVTGMDEPYRFRNKAQYPVGRSTGGGSSVRPAGGSLAGSGFSMRPVAGTFSNPAGGTVVEAPAGQIVCGFYAVHSHRIVPVEDCLTGQPENRRILRAVRDSMRIADVSAYNEADGTGHVRHVLVRKGMKTGQIMVCVVVNAEEALSRFRDVLILRLTEETGDVSSICLNYNTRRDNVIMGTRTECIYGRPYIEDVLCGLRFRISAQSFYQVNPQITEKLYETVAGFAVCTAAPESEMIAEAERVEAPDGNEAAGKPVSEPVGDAPGLVIWDLYSGIGTISLMIAKRLAEADRAVCDGQGGHRKEGGPARTDSGTVASHVYGIEIVPDAVADAKENARLNGIENVSFVCARAEEIRIAADVPGPEPVAADRALANAGKESVTEERKSADAGPLLPRPDVIIVDPPRAGCDRALLDTILRVKPSRVVYVSCDPATLARDLKILCAGGVYAIRAICPYDMFCQTTHVETVCLLSNTQRPKKESYITLDVEMEDYYRIKNEGKNSTT